MLFIISFVSWVEETNKWNPKRAPREVIWNSHVEVYYEGVVRPWPVPTRTILIVSKTSSIVCLDIQQKFYSKVLVLSMVSFIIIKNNFCLTEFLYFKLIIYKEYFCNHFTVSYHAPAWEQCVIHTEMVQGYCHVIERVI